MGCDPKIRSVIIIGAGVFGLSTALHLQQRGYKNITIFDKQDFHASGYSPFEGGDSASADTQKVIRSAYGAQPLLQDLANRAIDTWRQWNKDSGEELFSHSGWARLTDTGKPMDVDIATYKTMSAAGLGHTQYFLHSPEDLARAEKDGWAGPRLDQFRRRERGLALDGVLDTNAGMAYADLACKYALKLVEAAGAKTVFGQRSGEFLNFLRDEKDPSRITGIATKDGQTHIADSVIVAAGPYTHQINPELQPFVTATAGNFIFIKVPQELQHRYKPDVFPTWAWNYSGNSESPGLTGFPLDRHGIIKISYRSPKWTNPTYIPSSSNNPVSVPATASEVSTRGPPLLPLEATKAFVRENMPELVGAEIIAARMCWYTDSTDLNFVIDRVPGTSGLIVATAGSGHGFKFLPVLGHYVVDVLEGTINEYTKLWQWRKPTEDQLERIRSNTTSDQRDWHKQTLSSSIDLKW